MAIVYERDFRCAHCKSKTIDCSAHFITEAGDVWRVPVKVCTNEQCLVRQGATVMRAEKREYPELKDTPSLQPSEWANQLAFPISPTP